MLLYLFHSILRDDLPWNKIARKGGFLPPFQKETKKNQTYGTNFLQEIWEVIFLNV